MTQIKHGGSIIGSLSYETTYFLQTISGGAAISKVNFILYKKVNYSSKNLFFFNINLTPLAVI